jgi:hypothetical protein
LSPGSQNRGVRRLAARIIFPRRKTPPRFCEPGLNGSGRMI